MDKKIINHRLGRREVLQGAAGLMGGALLPIHLSQAISKTVSESQAHVQFWNGASFVPANRASADLSLDSVRVSITGFGTGPVSAIDSQTGHLNERGEPVRFYAWTAPPRGHRRTSFVACVKSGELRLVAHLHREGSTEELHVPIRTNGTGAQLQEGTYLLTPENVKTAFLSLEAGDGGSRLESLLGSPLPSQYLLIEIRRESA